MTDKIRERLNSLNEARKKATQGEWDEDIGASSNFFANYDVFFARGPLIQKDEEAAKTDSKFITLAANEWTNLVEALEMAVEVFSDEQCDCVSYADMDDEQCPRCYALTEIAKKLGCDS